MIVVATTQNGQVKRDGWFKNRKMTSPVRFLSKVLGPGMTRGGKQQKGSLLTCATAPCTVRTYPFVEASTLPSDLWNGALVSSGFVVNKIKEK